METVQNNRLWFEADAEKRGLDLGIKRGIDQGLKEGQRQMRQMLYSLVRRGKLTMAEAAEEAGVPIQTFRQDMDNDAVAAPSH